LLGDVVVSNHSILSSSRVDTRVSSDFFDHDTPPSATYALSLHDALPIFAAHGATNGIGTTRQHSSGLLNILLVAIWQLDTCCEWLILRPRYLPMHSADTYI